MVSRTGGRAPAIDGDTASSISARDRGSAMFARAEDGAVPRALQAGLQVSGHGGSRGPGPATTIATCLPSCIFCGLPLERVSARRFVRTRNGPDGGEGDPAGYLRLRQTNVRGVKGACPGGAWLIARRSARPPPRAPGRPSIPAIRSRTG
jgi:hypothetical protein